MDTLENKSSVDLMHRSKKRNAKEQLVFKKLLRKYHDQLDLEEFAHTLGNRFREERLRLEYSQKDLAEVLQLTAPTLSKIEQGRNTSLIFRSLQIMNIVGFDLPYLFYPINHADVPWSNNCKSKESVYLANWHKDSIKKISVKVKEEMKILDQIGINYSKDDIDEIKIFFSNFFTLHPELINSNSAVTKWLPTFRLSYECVN